MSQTQAGPVPGQDYIVQPGDSLSSIAEKAYGDGGPSGWRRIYDHPENKAKIGADPNRIYPGMVLYIPVA